MSGPPSGTVTFLFTDIEGSTRLAQQFPAAWPGAQARHHAILQSTIESHSGYVFQVIGDAFCAAFHTALDALAAALEAQRRLHAEPWGDAVVRVRMGLHTGTAEYRDGNYEGYLTLVRVQRIMSGAYSGQVLMSQAAADLVGRDLPSGVIVQDLGIHRLKDLGHPEHLLQLVASDLPADFPALKTANHPSNLPRQLTSFIGREAEVADLRRRLTTASLLTLTGAGGVGKTRLALQVASEQLASYTDGVWFVELAPLADPSLISNAIASAVGVREIPGRPLLATLSDYFHEKTTLLVLDNCEHVLTESAHVVSHLLHAAAYLKIIATSREALGLAGEQAYRVPSLELPGAATPLEALSHVESVRLFVDRAWAARSGFALSAGNAPAVAQLCRRLDGVPLAIELAAARVKVFSPEQIASRLDDRFRLLTGGSRSALPRQQTLRAAIDWSYNLLSEPECALLRRLSVFAGGWTFDAAETVCADQRLPRNDILDLLTLLIDKSLVVCEERDGEVRYRLLETVRQYAREKLLDAGEMETLRDRHLDYFVGLAEEGGHGMEGRDQLRWEQRLETEFDNFRVALDWATDTPRTEAGLRIVGALWFFIFIGHIAEHFNRAHDLLAKPDGQIPSAVRALALASASRPAAFVGDIGTALQLAESALAMARSVHDRWTEAYSLVLCGVLTTDRDSAPLEQALAISRELNSLFFRGFVLWELSQSRLQHGEYTAAERDAQESIAVLQTNGDQHLLAGAHRGLGRVLLQCGDLERARLHLRESMQLNSSLGEGIGLARCLAAWADLVSQQGEYARATRLCAASLKWMESHGLQFGSLAEGKYSYDRAVEAARAHLAPSVFVAAFEEGRRMSLDEAVDYALAGSDA